MSQAPGTNKRRRRKRPRKGGQRQGDGPVREVVSNCASGGCTLGVCLTQDGTSRRRRKRRKKNGQQKDEISLQVLRNNHKKGAMSAKGRKRLQSKRDCDLRDRARATASDVGPVVTKVVKLIGQQLAQGTPVTTLADGRWRLVDKKILCVDKTDDDRDGKSDDDDLGSDENDGESADEDDVESDVDDGDDDDDQEDLSEGESDDSEGVGEAKEEDGTQGSDSDDRSSGDGDDVTLIFKRVRGRMVNQRVVRPRGGSASLHRQGASTSTRFSGPTSGYQRIGSHGKRGGRRRKCRRTESDRRKTESVDSQDPIQLHSTVDEDVCSMDDRKLTDDGPTMEVVTSKDGKRYRITAAGELEDVAVPADNVVVPLDTSNFVVVKEWRMIEVRQELPGIPGWLRFHVPSHRQRVQKQVQFTWRQDGDLRSAFNEVKLRAWYEQQDPSSKVVQRHGALRALAQGGGSSSQQTVALGRRTDRQARVFTGDSTNTRKRVRGLDAPRCHEKYVHTEHTCSDWDARRDCWAHVDPSATMTTGTEGVRICYKDVGEWGWVTIPTGSAEHCPPSRSALQVAIDKLDSYGLWRYARCDQVSAPSVRDKAAVLSEQGPPVIIVESLYWGQSLAIQRWADRQLDMGRAAVIVNAFGGEPYTGCRPESTNVVTLALRDPSALTGLEGYLGDVLVVGYVAEDHSECWNNFRKNHPELNFVIAADEHYLPSVTGEDLFVQPRFRTVGSERWYRGAAAIQDRHIMTVSTVPLAYYPSDLHGFPDADTIANSSEALEKALQVCKQDDFNSENIPVYELQDLPEWTGDEKDGSSHPPSLLGYNCNGLRASYVRDDWSKILKDSPDIVAICEIKGSLRRLQTFLKGTMWASFRALYPFMHVFPARSPNTGSHGTAIFCKHRPDAWVVGMSTPISDAGQFDKEGRQVGLIQGRRYTSVSYAKTAGFMNANITLTKEYWRMKTEAAMFVSNQGYFEQGYGDLNIVRDATDYINPFTMQAGQCTTRPACTAEELKLIQDFFTRTAFLDFCHPKDEGKHRFTYYHTLRDRITGDGLRIDYIYGNFATWAEGRMVVRHDIPGDDHLPVHWQPRDDSVSGKYEEDYMRRDMPLQCRMMRQLNPRKLDTSDVLRLGAMLKAIDQSRSMGLGSDNHGHSNNDGKSIDLKVRRVYRLTARAAQDDSSCPPMLGFQFNDCKEELHIVDSGADVNVLSVREARRFLGNDYELHGAESPLRLAGVFGEPQIAEGYVNIPVRLTYDNGRQTVEQVLKFYVFEDPSTPTLMGFPAMNALGVGLAQKWDAQKNVNVPIALITNKEVRTEEPLRTGAPHGGCFVLSEAARFVPVVAATDCMVHPGRNLLRVRVPVDCTEVCMSMTNMEHMDADGGGFVLENNTFQPDGGFAHVTLNVTAPHPVHIREGLHLNDAIVLPERCVDVAKFVKHDLPLSKSRSFLQKDLGRTFTCYRARGESVASEHCSRTDCWTREQQDNRTDDVTVVPAASPSVSRRAHATPAGAAADPVSTPASDPPSEHTSSDQFWELPRYAKFQQGGLKMFRPPADEVRRLRDIPEYTPDGAKVDTLDDVCQVLLRADQKGVVYEQGSPLPVAREEAVVRLKPGASKVTAGFAQNNRGPGEEQIVQKETNKLVAINAAEKVNYEDIEYCSRIMLVPKPNGDWRFCVDLRGVNKNVEIEHWPLTKVDIRLQGMSGAQFFSTLDLPQAFHNIPLAEESRKYFGFKAPDGLYRYKTLPMGFVNSMALFTRLMDTSMIGLGSFVSVYVDDLIVFSRTWSQHMDHLDQVFTRLQGAGLKVNLAKCAFAREEVPFLGHLVTRDGVKMDPAKVAALDNMPLPNDLTKLRSFLGASGHYRKFVKDYAMLARPLSELTKKCKDLKKEIQTSECKQSFESLKAALRSGQVLQHPDIDRQWVLSCDASKYGVACVLQQRIVGLPDCDGEGN